MRVLIVSDTHRRNDNYFKVLERVAPVDMVIHCGDAEGSEYILSESAGCPFKIVLGNNDFFSNLPRELEFEVEQYKFWVTHGHNYYVSMDNVTIKKEAIARGKDIVIYGHTHRPLVEQEENLITVNPGSLSYPRQEGHRPSFIIMEIDRDKKIHFTINYL